MADLVRARVELRGCMSHTARGRTFKKGQAQILTDASDVAFYQSLSDFRVVLLDAPVKRVAEKKATDADATKPSFESAVMAAEERKLLSDDDEDTDEGDADASGEADSGERSKKKKTKKRASRSE